MARQITITGNVVRTDVETSGGNIDGKVESVMEFTVPGVDEIPFGVLRAATSTWVIDRQRAYRTAGSAPEVDAITVELTDDGYTLREPAATRIRRLIAQMRAEGATDEEILAAME